MKLENRAWYRHFMETAKRLKYRGLNQTDIEICLDEMYHLMNRTHGFKYLHVAQSAHHSKDMVKMHIKKIPRKDCIEIRKR